MITTPDEALAQGLHRQRRRARRAWPSSSPSSRSAASPRACTRSWCRSATARRARCPASRIEDDGRKIGLNGVDNGRLWFDGVRVPRDEPAQPLRRRRRGRHLRLSPIDNPRPPLLHDARHAGAGPGLRRRRRHQRRKVALTIAVKYAAAPAPVRRARRRRGGAAPRLRHAPASAVPAAGAHLRAALRPGGAWRCELHDVFSSEQVAATRRPTPARAGVAGRRHQGARHLARHPHHPGVPRGVRRRRLPRRQPVRRAQGRHRRVHHVRGRQPRAAAAGRQGAAHRLRQSTFEDLDQLGMVRFVAGLAVETVVERTSVAQAARADQGRAARRRRRGTRRPGLLDPNYQLAMLRFREEHMLVGRRPPAQARHRRRAWTPVEVFSRVAGPRDRRRPRARRAAGAGGVRRQGRRPSPTATTRSRSGCSATCTRSPRSRPTAAGSWSTAGSPSQRSKAITREVSSLCRQVRPLAEDLVDAFGVPAGDAPRRAAHAPAGGLSHAAGLSGPAAAGAGCPRGRRTPRPRPRPRSRPTQSAPSTDLPGSRSL